MRPKINRNRLKQELGEIKMTSKKKLFPKTNRVYISVTSEVITSFDYDVGSKSLFVNLSNGGTYIYLKVPMILVLRFIYAKSKGRFYNKNIKDIFKHKKSNSWL